MVVLVDVPGYLPGVGQEWDGVVRRGAKLLHAFAESVVPRVTLVTRKTYGGAYIAMNARSLGATRVFAWPRAEVAVMGAVAAIRVLHRRKLAEVAPELRPQVEAELAAEHEKIAGGIERAIEIGVVDEVVEPARTRTALATAIAKAEAHHRGKDRPVLVVGSDGPWLLALILTSKDHDRDAADEARWGRVWLDIGNGAWDKEGRNSEVRLDRVLRIDPRQVRREGSVIGEAMFNTVAEHLHELHRA
jgi:hypothetical protein